VKDTNRCIEHRDVVDENILDNVDFAGVLAQGANRDSVRAVAVQVLDEDVGAVGLECDTVCIKSILSPSSKFRGNITVAVVDHRVLDNDIV
jgi:hypothetical protein